MKKSFSPRIMRPKVIIASLAAVMVLMTGCKSHKDFVYLQDMSEGIAYPFESRHEPVVHRDDRLNITVSAKQPELAIPFNVQSGALKVGPNGEVVSGDVVDRGYRVDEAGQINFPILGHLKVEGMTLGEVRDTITSLIANGNYIKNPMVTVDFNNFKYTVLGAVGSNGTFTVDGDRVTLIEAIAKAGDLKPDGRTDNVAVIRENGNERQVYYHDLTSKDLFNSPCFYLQQNDIVYVEPKHKKDTRESDNTWKWITGVLSLISTTCAVIWVTK